MYAEKFGVAVSDSALGGLNFYKVFIGKNPHGAAMDGHDEGDGGKLNGNISKVGICACLYFFYFNYERKSSVNGALLSFAEHGWQVRSFGGAVRR